MRPHLTVEQRQLALRLKARGLSLREIGPQVGCSHQGVALVVRQAPRRSGQVSRRTCWMLMTSWLSYGVTLYQMVTPSEGRCSSYAPGNGSSVGNGSARAGTGSSR